MTSTNFSQRLASLPPEKQKLLLQRLKERQNTQHQVEIPQQDRTETDRFPLSFSQERLWFLSQLEPDNPFYNVPGAVDIEGNLDVDLIEQCFNEIIRRHESLRTHFQYVENRSVQIINPPQSLKIAVVDLSSLPIQQQRDRVEQLIQTEARTPFDLKKPPLLRVKLLKLAQEHHILLFTLHHIISDARSRSVMLREFTTLYQALGTQQTPNLPALPIQYADFAVWQRQQSYSQQLDYWQDRLSPLPQPFDLPSLLGDRARPQQQTFHGAQQSVRFSVDLTAEMRALAKKTDLTLYMLLLAAFQVLLHRYSQQTDFAIGSPIDNRSRAEAESLIGFLTNTLVLRADCAGDPTFLELLQRVKETALGAYSNAEIPFEKLVETLQTNRSLNRTPLFQVLLAFHDFPILPQLPNLKFTLRNTESGTAKFDLSLLMRLEKQQELVGVFEYNTDLLTEAEIARLATHFQTLVADILSQPNRRISQFDLLTSTEKAQALARISSSHDPFPKKCVHEEFEAQVSKTPNHIAVTCGEEFLTYAALNKKANQLARQLCDLGVEADRCVGICLPRSRSAVIAILAVLKAGGAYVPLDPTYPASRLTFMLQDAGVRVLISQPDLRTSLPPHNAQIIDLDETWQSQEDDTNLNIAVAPEHLAYVIYTSGSTGQPKGVAMPHRPLQNLIQWQCQTSQLKEKAKTLQFAPLSFDVSFQECFATWSSGGALVLIPETVRKDSDALLDLLSQEQIERLFLPFVALSQLAIAAQRRKIPLYLREVVTAGEQLQITPAIASFFSSLPHCTLENQYGPSETHVVTAHQLTGSPENWSVLPPIGRSITNAGVYLLDCYHNLVPSGLPGEICVGGVAVARGYLNRPDLTRDRFIENPFGDGILYKTGDLAREDPNGNLHYLGRRDNQVKLRGFRLELGEIEAVLAQYPQARQVAANLCTFEGNERRLIAYVVPKTTPQPGTSELRNFLRDRLPDYMMPSAIVWLDELPLTPSGKLDRRSLPLPSRDRPELETAYIAPKTLLERQVAEIWQNLLQVDRIGMNDNFFDLGGHSLLMIQVRSHLETRLQREIPLVTLFQYPTAMALASHLAQDVASPTNRLRQRAQDRAAKRRKNDESRLM